MMGIKEILSVGLILAFATFTILNLRKWLRYKTSLVPTAVSILFLLFLVLKCIGNPYADLLFLIVGLIAITYLPNVWRDLVKVLRQEKINPKERIKPRDYFSWSVFVKLGYRYGVRKASLLYALMYSVIFATFYYVAGTLLSMEYVGILTFLLAVTIFPINYRLARKVIEKFNTELS